MAKGKAKKGCRLVGWLVSYGLDSQGLSYELRAGRSFISSKTQGDDPTLEVGEKGISAPHIAIRTDENHRVLVQDVFSDSGSYLMRVGSAKEVELSGPTEVAHGDWIRVGDNTRFQVCIIDGAGR